MHNFLCNLRASLPCSFAWSRRLLTYHLDSSFITSFIFLPLSFYEHQIPRILNYLQFPKPSILFLVPYLTTTWNGFCTKSSKSNILQEHLCGGCLPVPQLRDITNLFLHSVFHMHISVVYVLYFVIIVETYILFAVISPA